MAAHQRQVQPLHTRRRRRRGPLPRLGLLPHPGNHQHHIRVRHRSGETSAINFAPSALEVRCVLASLENIFCSGSRAGCVRLDFAGDTPATTVRLDRLPRFLLDITSRPQLSQGRLEPDYGECSSISPRSFRRSAECDQRIQVAKGAETSARQTWRALNHQSK